MTILPQHMNRLVVIKNAIANVVRLVASALVGLLLTPFLVRTLPTETYGAWVLILQLSAYIYFLEFGIQTAIARFVAQSNELRNSEQRDRIVSTSFVLLIAGAVIGMFLIVLLAWQLPDMFRSMPKNLQTDAQFALLLVGGSLAICLPSSVFNGIFLGLQRNEVLVKINIVGRLISAVLLIMIVNFHPSIVLMGTAIAATNLSVYVLTYLACRKLVPDAHISFKLVSKPTGKEILAYCFSLSIWSFGSLLVSGLDTAIVGFFDFKSVGYYAIALTLTNLIIQLQSAMFSALMPAAAVLQAQGNVEDLGKLLVSSTRYGMFILLFTGLPLIIGAKLILTLWVGTTYAVHTAILLQVLVVANIVRLSGLPYATLLIGTGQQKLVIISPLVEGFANIIVSVFATASLGSVGAAIGTLFGSFISIGFHIVYNMPRTKNIKISRRSYVMEGILRPLISTAPSAILMVSLITFPHLEMQTALFVSLVSIAFVTTLFIVWQWLLLQSERKKILLYLKIKS